MTSNQVWEAFCKRNIWRTGADDRNEDNVLIELTDLKDLVQEAYAHGYNESSADARAKYEKPFNGKF